MSQTTSEFDSLLMPLKSSLDIIFIAQFRRIKFRKNLRELSNGNHHNNHLFLKNFDDDRSVVLEKQYRVNRNG
jgi:hypothetical protein